MDKLKLKNLVKKGFSIIPCDEKKCPIGSWKKYQTTPMTEKQVESLDSPLYGIVTGYNNIEVVDVDLKVFSSLKEQTEFWNEYLSFLKDNIDDFDKKFVIAKTKNAGYHILYRCKEIEGNKKIARLENHVEAIIETRGIGGMVIVYDNFVSELSSYAKIQEISIEDRFILMSCSKTYNFIIENNIEPETKKIKEYSESSITPWKDYNEKTSIFDIIDSEFKIVRQLNDKYIIKRNGANSPHSGYIYKNSGCMFLFSTGTIYPNEKLITPFIAYTFKYHNGDFKDAGAELYKLGFGSRVVKKDIKFEEPKEINKADLIFPIDVFPKPIQSYLLECNSTLDSSIDYMGCSLLWLISVCIGNTINVKVKNGWNENATIWCAVVGKAGLGKTPSINNIIFPLQKVNNKQIKDYLKNLEKFNFYDALSKKEKEEYEEVKKPVKSQFIADNITLEALVDLHQESPNAVGVFKDELAGWFKEMNQYRAGSDLEFWLSTWSGKSVNLNRLTRAGSFVDKPLIPVIGGIQPGILSSFYTEENKDNGFVDRMLLCYPELNIDLYNDREMDSNTINWYSDTMISFYETIKLATKKDEDDNIIPLESFFNAEAKIEWKRIFNDITNVQNSEDENEYMKSMLPKQKSYIPRFALLIHSFNSFFDETNTDTLAITKESILKAEILSKYFISMAKKIKTDSVEKNEYKSILIENKSKNKFEQFKVLYAKNENINKKEVAELLGISVQMVYKYIKEIKKV
mgnify:CR=1 FL=1|tara:strand:+ start:158 stop:2389 length:2232 start_codon:yes stop_codon:yes gene_type:complete